VIRGRQRPSVDLAKRIEAATDGRIKAIWLLGLEEPPSDLSKAS
jgi:hypothetical protein